jgi:3-hydroxyisobutyrate dehydrogenase
MRIGIAGTGRMGAALAQRLLALGHEVRVWNRTRDKAAALERDGAKLSPHSPQIFPLTVVHH